MCHKVYECKLKCVWWQDWLQLKRLTTNRIRYNNYCCCCFALLKGVQFFNQINAVKWNRWQLMVTIVIMRLKYLWYTTMTMTMTTTTTTTTTMTAMFNSIQYDNEYEVRRRMLKRASSLVRFIRLLFWTPRMVFTWVRRYFNFTIFILLLDSYTLLFFYFVVSLFFFFCYFYNIFPSLVNIFKELSSKCREGAYTVCLRDCLVPYDICCWLRLLS